ncbi:MAG: hypothetical protein M1814_006350 [Vezdaea aestivalis]|nr:MAG: hypothetical protein M1814_006350 [Vezdaea aestivalis]
MANSKLSPLGRLVTKKAQVVFFSSTAIALYGYDQGMMSLINTNYSYLHTVGIPSSSSLVGIVVSVYYLGCTVGAVLASSLSDRKGRKLSIFVSLITASLGNLIMFIAGLGQIPSGSLSLTIMLAGRVVMGLGVGGIDAVIPVYSSELSDDGARGRALAQEFQANIFGLLLAYALNLLVTFVLGKYSQWAWRIPIIFMQLFPLILIIMIQTLPETPRWLMAQQERDKAEASLKMLYDEEESADKLDSLAAAIEDEQDSTLGYADMLLPGRSQFHPTSITVMGQINQALTGYGAVSVYGPQIFELLGFKTQTAELLTLGNYVSYFILMTLAWLWIDRFGRRMLMIWGSEAMAVSFLLLTILGGLAMNSHSLKVAVLAFAIPGAAVLFFATAAFGIGWLATVWVIPTEIYPSSARAKGAAVSVVVWGIANFAVTILTPIGFNNLKYWLFLVFAITNEFAGWWTWTYSPETGSRSFEENQEFFDKAEAEGSWSVRKVDDGIYKRLPRDKRSEHSDLGEDGEREPLL